MAVTLALHSPHLLRSLIVEDVSPRHSAVTRGAGFVPSYVQAMVDTESLLAQYTNTAEARRELNKRLVDIIPVRKITLLCYS